MNLLRRRQAVALRRGRSTVGLKEEHHLQVFVRDNNVDQALKALKRKMQREPSRDEAPRALRKALREESAGEGGSHSVALAS